MDTYTSIFRGYAHYSVLDKNWCRTLTDESFNRLKFVLFGQTKTPRSHYAGRIIILSCVWKSRYGQTVLPCPVCCCLGKKWNELKIIKDSSHQYQHQNIANGCLLGTSFLWILQAEPRSLLPAACLSPTQLQIILISSAAIWLESKNNELAEL